MKEVGINLDHPIYRGGNDPLRVEGGLPDMNVDVIPDYYKGPNNLQQLPTSGDTYPTKVGLAPSNP